MNLNPGAGWENTHQLSMIKAQFDLFVVCWFYFLSPASTINDDNTNDNIQMEELYSYDYVKCKMLYSHLGKDVDSRIHKFIDYHYFYFSEHLWGPIMKDTSLKFQCSHCENKGRDG